MARTLTATAALLAVLLAGCATEDSPDEAGVATFVAEDLEFTEAPDRLPAGEVTVELVNDADLVHNVVIEELDDRLVVEAQGGDSATGTVTLEPGTYTYYCSVPGHREAGMEGTVTVE